MEKLDSIVNNAIKNCPKGDKFFDIIDSELKKPQNEDIILKLFSEIYEDFGQSYNMVLSGGFSDYILHLIKESKIVCRGTILQLSGSLTSHKGEIGKIIKNKEVSVIFQTSDISEKDFIFVDDSYFSGTTEKVIEEYLKKYNSNIISTYVVYDGNIKKDPNRTSLYNYFDHHKGVKKPVEDLLTYMHKFKDIPYDTFQDRIVKGKISTMFDLKNQVNKFHRQVGSDKTINPFSHVKLERIKRFDSFNESVTNEDLYDIKDMFQEIADKYNIKYVGQDSLHKMDTDVFYDNVESVYTIFLDFLDEADHNIYPINLLPTHNITTSKVSIDILIPNDITTGSQREFKIDIRNFKKRIKSVGYGAYTSPFVDGYFHGIIYSIFIYNI